MGSLFAKLLKRMRVRLFAKVISRTCGGRDGNGGEERCRDLLVSSLPFPHFRISS